MKRTKSVFPPNLAMQGSLACFVLCWEKEGNMSSVLRFRQPFHGAASSPAVLTGVPGLGHWGAMVRRGADPPAADETPAPHSGSALL